jgi:pimeloyl-ACP methyl ester carboxylesterase
MTSATGASRHVLANGDARGRLLAGLPLDETRAEIAGVSTTLLEGGDGPPLILLHGGIECGGVYWTPVVRGLIDRYRLLIPDLPGLGESQPFDQLDQVNFTAWLRALVENHCAVPPGLIAHSLDGGPAARFAAEHGDMLERLMIYAAPGVGPYRMPIGLRIVAVRFGIRPTARNAERFQRWAFFDLERFRAAEARWLEAFGAYSRQRAAIPHVKRTMRALVALGTARVSDEDLARIGPRCALIWGRHDRFVPLAVAEAAATRLGWPLTVIEEAGHVPHIERARAFVNALSA